MFDRQGKKVHQNPPRVFGPGSAIQECMDFQESFTEELLAVLEAVVPEDKQSMVVELREKYTQGISELKHQHALQILNGQGEHSALEHYMVRFQNQDPAEGQPFPFPNPGSSIFFKLRQLVVTTLASHQRDLQLKGAGCERLLEGWDLLGTKTGFYYTPEGKRVLVLNTQDAVSLWGADKEEGLRCHWPAQTFYTRTNIEAMIQEFFSATLEIGIDITSGTPLTEGDITTTLQHHLPRQFHDPSDDRHLQPRELQAIITRPFGDVGKEYDRMEDYEVGVRVTHDGTPGGVDHLLVFKVPDDGLVVYHPDDGVSFWHYSTQEGVWAYVPEYLPYVPREKFEAAMCTFFKQYRYEPLEPIGKTYLRNVTLKNLMGKQVRSVGVRQLAEINETGLILVQFNDPDRYLAWHHYCEKEETHTLVMLCDEKPPEEVVLEGCDNGGCYHWDDLNPPRQHQLMRCIVGAEVE